MSLSKDLLFVILQFLHEENFKETAHMFERETGFFFDMRYFEDMLLSGKWDETERYLSGFTAFDDNKYSTKIYFEIRKQKFFEALDEHDNAKALNILLTDLKVFAPDNEELYKEMTLLLTLNDIREHHSLSTYGDTKSARAVMVDEVKKLIETNPLFLSKLQFPRINGQRLRRLINQSLNWQHIRCTNPLPNPDIKTLFLDHVCQPNDPLITQPTGNCPLPSEEIPGPVSTSLYSWTSSISTVTQSAVSGGAFDLIATAKEAKTEESFKDPFMLSDILSEETEIGTLDEVISQKMYPPGQSSTSEFKMLDDLPKTVAQILNESLPLTSMDFHPVWQTILLVGNNMGDIGLWEVISGKKLLSISFSFWDIGACSGILKAALVKDPCVSINRLLWAPDGSLFGIAYSKHILQLYSYSRGQDARRHLEVDAHVGGVNDLAFSEPYKKLLLVSCGDDKIIKVWDALTGAKQFSLEGHGAAVYSVCPHYKDNIHFIFSTSVDGTIKVWLYDQMGSRVDYEAPGLCCTTMAYSDDGKRLFSCGTSKDGQSYIVEWNESEGHVKRTYQGLQKYSSSVIKFDTTKNQYLAAGDGHLIKIWHMDKIEILTTTDADGDLPASPLIHFNKEGTLLAVPTRDNRIKILANDGSLELFQTSDQHSTDASCVLSESFLEILDNGDLKNVKPTITESTDDKIQKLFEINNASQFQSLKLAGNEKLNKISRLIYTNEGRGILALASNGIHLLWKWQQNDLNSNGQATTKVTPQLWQPRSGKLMNNDVAGIVNPEEVVHCCALSKNDSYLMSASGGKVSLFNILSFKTMTTLMPPPPAVTSIAFNPQDNNEIAFGRCDTTIMIYNVRRGEVKSKLEGHSKRVTGLAFSTRNTLVSSGADAQIIVWNVDNWTKYKSIFVKIPYGNMIAESSDLYIQLHHDQTHLLAVHKTHLAVYETINLECIKQWVPGETAAPISHATLSCDSQLVYASFQDGRVSILCTSDLQIQCQINPTAYLDPVNTPIVYPVVIAAHPKKPNQIAVGLTNGEIYVFEPLDSEGKWDDCLPSEAKNSTIG